MNTTIPLKKWTVYNMLTILWECERRPVWSKNKMCWFEKCKCKCWKELRVNRDLIKRWWVKSCWCWKVKPLKAWDKYWRLTVLWEYERRKVWNSWKYQWYEKCKCDCWNELWINKNAIVKWHTKSCWCLSTDKVKERFTKHWWYNTRLYRIFYDIKSRCLNSKNTSYKYYWWRWIKCLWNKYEDFKKDMIEWYDDSLTIDRIDTNWDYCKENCRRVDMKKQLRNTRRNRYFEWWWEKLTVPEIYNKEKPDIKYKTFEARLYRYWRTVEDALYKKPNKILNNNI